jgi:hypothetical protein
MPLNQGIAIYTSNLDVNINEVAIEMEVGMNNFTNRTQELLINANLFSLPHLFMRKIHSKELLVDYF